jgi:adenosylhomocysteine nucleosidase
MKRLLFLFLCFPVVAGCAPIRTSSVEPVEPAPRIAVLSAFAPEMKHLLKELDQQETWVINGRSYHTGVLAGKPVVLGISGVSMVNAAMAAQAVIDHFDVRAVIFSGIAGGVNPGLSVGDVVVPAQWGQYQEQVFAREVEGGWDTGYHTEDYGHYGMMFPQAVSVTQRGGRADAEEERFWFPVSEEMLQAAAELDGRVELRDCTLLGKCLGGEPRLVVGGNGVSGPTFVDNADYRLWVWETFQADALDMESAAVAHVAYANDVPFLAFRSLSDLAGGGPGENEISTFFQLAADNSARVVMAFLDTWDPEWTE